MKEHQVSKRRGRPARRPEPATYTAKQLADEGRSKNTDAAFRSAINHYVESHGGRLPATPADVMVYLETYQSTLSVTTLRQRMWAIGKYHRELGYPDPTRSSDVAVMLAGIARKYAKAPKKARPLSRRDLAQAVSSLEAELLALSNQPDGYRRQYRPLRDRALILIGFWLGLRSDELARLTIEGIQLDPLDAGRRLAIFLPNTKTISSTAGTTWYLHEMKTLCPVNAYLDWTHHAGLTKGPVFRGIDAGQNISEEQLHTGSITGILRRALSRAGLEGDSYSSHSMRRGIATCWYAAGGTLETLMHHVKWKSPMTAIGYQDEVRSLPLEMIEKWDQLNVLPVEPDTLQLERFLNAADDDDKN